MSRKKRDFHTYKEIIKGQFNLFLLALSFFSRIPTPKSMSYSPNLLNQANRYFSLVGLLLALLQGGFFFNLYTDSSRIHRPDIDARCGSGANRRIP